MKIIVNRGFDNMLTSIVVFKNGQPAIACPIQKDFCEMDAKEGDRIEIKLIAHGMISQRLAAFTYQEDKDTIYIQPTLLCKRWEVASYRVLPYFSLFFVVLHQRKLLPNRPSSSRDKVCRLRMVLRWYSRFDRFVLDGP